MKRIRDIIAVIVGVAGLFLLILALAKVLAPTAAVVGAVFFVGGLVMSGVYAIADKLERMETRSDQADPPSEAPKE